MAIQFLVLSIVYLWAFWGMYVLVMGIYRAHLSKRLKGFVRILSFPFVVIGFLMDVLANLILASIIFVEPPRELLVTGRLKRLIKEGDGWRRRLAKFICDHLLDVFDPNGDHC